VNSYSQEIIRGIGNRVQQIGKGGRLGTIGSTGGNDSLHHRDGSEDSITISYRYLDSTRTYKLDSSISDFTTRFPIPAHYVYLGNIGNAARSILFLPSLSSGWDPGFHSFDIYKWKLEKVRFFNTTRPYSELSYLLGSRVEQVIELLHTQNIKPNWNASFNYRLINSPGFFKNQKTNDNNYQLTSWFQTKNKRYNNYFILLINKLQSSENGGMQDTTNFLKHPNPVYKNRFNIPTKIGGDDPYSSNFFTNKITTGNQYYDFNILLRQQYDLGRKDSLVTDSTIIPLFFPRLRFEHTISLNNQRYEYVDIPHSTNSFQFYFPDSAYYQDNYGLTLHPGDTVHIKEQWRNISNDFSIYQFPDARNLQQFIKLGITIQNLTGQFTSGKKTFYNLFGHAEYRNRSKNQKWDIEANGKLYFTGLNAADYNAYVSLQRLVGNKLGYLQLGFANANRSPYFFYDPRSSFYLMHTVSNFKKENNSDLFASYFLPSFKFRLTGHYYLLNNFTYISNYYQLHQQTSLFNVVQVAAQKTFSLTRHLNWHADVYLQQVIGNSPVNIPQLFTRNRIAYEGNFGFKNLDIATGLEIRYRSPYKADRYSPVLGQFFYQDSLTVTNTPDISAYVQFRIRSFKGFLRAENLNTIQRSTSNGGIGFTNNNVISPGYALPGLQIRFGVYWSFVN
jgi:hypothetical protein